MSRRENGSWIFEILIQNNSQTGERIQTNWGTVFRVLVPAQGCTGTHFVYVSRLFKREAGLRPSLCRVKKSVPV